MKKKFSRILFRTRQRQRISRRTVILVSAFSFLLISGGLFTFFNLTQPQSAFADYVDGDYRSKATGNWGTIGTWERFDGTSWVAAPATPTDTVGNIYIISPNVVTIATNVSIDQVIVNAGATLVNASGKVVTLKNGGGTDMDVSGIFKNAGTVTIIAGATIAYQSTGKYQHNFTTTAGTIPAATWISGSTCEIIGYTSNTAATGGMQAFSNFTWNCPSQSSDINLNGTLTTVNGDFLLARTGSKKLILASATSALTIGGNITLTSGDLIFTKQNLANYTLTVGGNFLQSGGNFRTVDADLQTGTINLSGDWSITGGTISVTKPGSNVQVIFKKAGTQAVTSTGGSITGNVDFTVNNGTTLDMANYVLGGRNFTLSSGASLIIGAAAGITASTSAGNIQSSGTRSYNTGANYTYNGTAAQSTGSGLPSSVNSLTVYNSSNLTLTNTVSVSGIITLTSGKIITGTNELVTTNTAISGFTGYSSTNYVVGNFRRSVTGTGAYDFPVGTSTQYELINVNLAGTTGFSNILGKFTQGNPIVNTLPLVGVIVNGLTIDKMLNYGYWTLTPNLVLLTGSYTVSVSETGFTNGTSGAFSYTLLKRANSLLSWQSLGVQSNNTQTLVGGVASAARSGLTSFSDFAIGYGEYLNFKNPFLNSGVAGQVDAVYVFPNVCGGVDAWVKITDFTGGASLSDMDHFSAGYDEGWQPFINCPPNATSSIGWEFTFKKNGTSADTTLPYLAITGVDVDGDGSYLKEFVEATMPYSYALDPVTILTVTNNNGRYRATSTTANVANIDTSQHQAMFQINYQNVNKFNYRTGAVSTYSSNEVRQNSLYFHSFFTDNFALPIKLVYFKAKLNEGVVKFDWATAAEINNNFFTIERSEDGENFLPVLHKQGAGNSTTNLYYNAADQSPLTGYSYYRLKQTDYDGHYSYSEIQTIKNGSGDKPETDMTMAIKSVYPNPFITSFKLNFMIKSSVLVDFTLMNTSGQIVAKTKIQADEGYNTYEFLDDKNLEKGIYFAMISHGDEKQIQKIVKN
ncbi:hypothetical protein BH11BAC1_BH11BAC1_21530 [soil metagenome]